MMMLVAMVDQSLWLTSVLLFRSSPGQEGGRRRGGGGAPGVTTLPMLQSVMLTMRWSSMVTTHDASNKPSPGRRSRAP